MPKLKTLLSLPAMLALISCSSMTLPAPVQDVNPPANLIEECPAPVRLAGDSMGEISKALLDNTAALQDCAARHRLLADWASKKNQ